MRLKPFIFFCALFITSSVFVSCDPDPDDTSIPKPRGYFRIDLPKHHYKMYDSLCPFAFETPKYSWVVDNMEKNAEPCWQNIYYPRFGAIVHLSYKTVPGKDALRTYMNDCNEFAKIHTVRANGLTENLIVRDSAKVYGLWYDINGNAASNIQFYLTDSSKNFIRGALYFSVKPNIDSLQPVVDFLREDIVHMLKTFRWKESDIEFKTVEMKKPEKLKGK
ncbi:MAG: gliding motility lipoprotein GldD [Bacteroidia bacterium]|nr:gliding motility lipoprotein GldD [Bacteroidia bacterium]